MPPVEWVGKRHLRLAQCAAETLERWLSEER